MEVVKPRKKTKKKTKHHKDKSKDEVVATEESETPETVANSHVTDDIIPSVPLPTQDDTSTVVVPPTQDDTVVPPTQHDTVVPPIQDDTVVPPTQDDTPTVEVPPTQDDIPTQDATPTIVSPRVEGNARDTKLVIDETPPTINNETKPDKSVDEFKPPTVTATAPLVGVSIESDLIQFEERRDRVDELGITVAGNESVAVETSNQVQITVVNETPSSPLIRYPRLDSLLEATVHNEVNDDLTPFTEEDLALMYVNPQLVANQEFIENFMKESEQSHHPLYELLNQYLKARLYMRTTEAKLNDMKRSYGDSVARVWEIEDKNITSNARCRDGAKVNHTHSHKFAQLNQNALNNTIENMKQLRNCLENELCLKSYSSQLGRIHVEYYLHQLLQSVPDLAFLPSNSPVAGYIPDSPPGSLDQYTMEIRNCVSVLCMFERRPIRDKTFSMECKQWLDLMMNALLRVASLSDHLFIMNHLLRCPPGVGKWGVTYLQPLSPLLHTGTPRPSSAGEYSDSVEYSLNWTTAMRGFGWGGPVLDHWVTMLCTLLMPISGRDELLCMLSADDPTMTGTSQRWTLVEEDLDEQDLELEESSLQLEESDYISFLDQFPFNDIFKYILGVTADGSYSVSGSSSHQMLQLISFCTCIIRILGTAFSSLRQSRYKEFVKQVGRTVRQVVHYVADHWLNYKAHKRDQGDAPSAVPLTEDGPYRYSIDRLQVEFDQFVLRATQWILTAHKLGAWQFMADMPYSSVSLFTLWKILWTLYHYQFSSGDKAGGVSGEVLGQSQEQGTDRRGSVLSGRGDLDCIPQSPEGVVNSIRDASCHARFVDVLMKTYTSESVFLLTTFTNMARSRSAHTTDEVMFIDTVTEEIFEFTQVEEYARDTYNRTGCHLLSTIASVHPFIISTLLNKAHLIINEVGENCNLVFKELPLHLWIPSREDMSIVYNWLTSKPLTSHENITAKIIISGMNWGVKDCEDNTEYQPSSSLSLILPLSLHREMALYLVEANARHLPSLPGGSDYDPMSSTFRKYASSIRSMMSPEQSEFSSWLWEVVLMLKLHPTQLSLMSILPPSPPLAPVHSSERGMAKDPAVYKQTNQGWDPSVDTMLPDLSDTSVNRLGILKEIVEKEGILAYYIALCLSNMGSLPDPFINEGLPMLNKLIEQGYYLPVLRVLGNVIPMMFGHRKALVNNQLFVSVLLSVANADINSASYKDILTWNTPSPLVVRRMSAMITTHVQHYGNSPADKQLVVLFWLESLFAVPNWIRETSVLYLLNGLCIAVNGNMPLEQLVLEQLIDQYTLLQPLQPKNKRLLSSVASSVISMVAQEGGGPSLYGNIPANEYPWLCYYVLRAEQQFEKREGIWKTVLSYMKKDQKISLENALKKSLIELHHNGSGFTAGQLSVFKWGHFVTSVDHTFLLAPLAWQRFFALYLQRPTLDHSSPERGSMGLRLFSGNRGQSLKREMKTALSAIVKKLQEEIDNMSGGTEERDKEQMRLVQFLPATLRYYQTLKLWIQEPKLHDTNLYLPSLPQQYDCSKLAQVFKPHQEDWMDFVRMWEIKELVRVMVHEWGQVVSYQNPLPCQKESLDANPETASARIQKRLSRRVTPVAPQGFQLPPAPFSLLSVEELLSKDTLLPSVIKDTELVAQQARIFVEKLNNLSALDTEYSSGVPELYANIDRQFHVNVPCRSKFGRNHECTGPATVVFRFKEMTPHTHWEERLTDNRKVHSELVKALSFGVSQEMCRAVARVEHAVRELLKLVLSTSNGEALSSGVALFYEILKFISMDIEKYPPSSQFFSSSVEVLGQEFIQNDPAQTVNILHLIVNQRPLAKLLTPIFIPNSCPAHFLSMYGTAGETIMKTGPEISFSILSKFNVSGWLKASSPSLTDCRTLLDHIFTGIKTADSVSAQSLLEIYLSHLRVSVEYQFPLTYNDVLYHLVSGTELSSIVSECWDVVLTVVAPHSTCNLGLQQVLDSVKYLSNHFTQKKLFTQEYLYDLIPHSHVASIGQFINMLARATISKTNDSIELHNITPTQGLTDCWHLIVDMFTPWIFPVHLAESSEAIILHPCKIEDIVLMSEILQLFTETLSTMHNTFKVHGECLLSLLWPFYCEQLALSDTPDHVLQCYHIRFANLPWNSYQPDLQSMELMLQLKIDPSIPNACFVFLGDILPLIDWKSLTAYHCSDSPPDVAVKFHIQLLQLLIMLSAENEVMSKKNAKFPFLLSQAQNLSFHYIDSKIFNDILEWLKDNSHTSAVLHQGSPLSSALRFLKTVASFPSSESTDCQLHQDHWEKRSLFIRFVVDLVSRASKQKDTHSLPYADIVAFMVQMIIDVSVFEPESCHSVEVTRLLQETLHLFNTCDPSTTFQHSLVEHFTSCLLELTNAQYICLPIITAACRSLVSVPLMGHVVENSIAAYFKYQPTPQSQSPLQLPPSDDGYGWRNVQMALTVPEAAFTEFKEHCITECSCLSLHTRLLQTFPLFTSLEHEYTVASDIVQWCTKLKPKAEQESGVFLIWEKAQSLLLRQVKFSGNIVRVVPHFTTLATTLLRYGEDKATEGLLGAIGLGKKSSFSIQFRLISRIIATFIHCQLPTDSNHSTIVRISPDAPGHIKTPLRQYSAYPVLPSKQADQAIASLEGLLSNKNYLAYKEFILYSLDFINDSRFCLLDTTQLLVYLVFNMYCKERCLDVLRVVNA